MPAATHLQDVPEHRLHEPVLQARARKGHQVSVQEAGDEHGSNRQDDADAGN